MGMRIKVNGKIYRKYQYVIDTFMFFLSIALIFAFTGLVMPRRIIIVPIDENPTEGEISPKNPIRVGGQKNFFTITGYSHLDSCHNPTSEGCLMANGKLATIGYVACPRSIPLGTKVEIFGKVYECGDRLSSQFKNRFDIWFGYGREAYQRALEFGKQKAEVVIL